MTITTYKPRHAARRRIRILPAMARTQGWTQPGPTWDTDKTPPVMSRVQNEEPPDVLAWHHEPPVMARASAPVKKMSLGRVILYAVGLVVGGAILGAILLTALAFALT